MFYNSFFCLECCWILSETTSFSSHLLFLSRRCWPTTLPGFLSHLCTKFFPHLSTGPLSVLYGDLKVFYEDLLRNWGIPRMGSASRISYSLLFSAPVTGVLGFAIRQCVVSRAAPSTKMSSGGWSSVASRAVVVLYLSSV